MVVKQVDQSNLQINVDPRLYSLEVIHKCFYWYGGKYAVDIEVEQDAYAVSISNIDRGENLEALIDKIKRDLIDFKTREIIFSETKNIREMLIAKAFANDDSFDEDPPGNVNDPLGFDPTNI